MVVRDVSTINGSNASSFSSVQDSLVIPEEATHWINNCERRLKEGYREKKIERKIM